MAPEMKGIYVSGCKNGPVLSFLNILQGCKVIGQEGPRSLNLLMITLQSTEIMKNIELGEFGQSCLFKRDINVAEICQFLWEFAESRLLIDTC